MENVHPKARHAACARALVRRARKAALGTIERASGHPFVSLVAIATEPNGTPILLLSNLALHTQNLAGDPRASLLIEATGPAGDALAGDRVSLIGRVAPLDGASARARFLARHPTSAALLDFADFQFYRLAVARAHFIGGFGRIVALNAADMLVPTHDAQALLAGEVELVSHLNAAHPDALAAIAVGAGARPGAWRLLAVDPEGLDLALGDETIRITFAARQRSPEEAELAILRLAGASA